MFLRNKKIVYCFLSGHFLMEEDNFVLMSQCTVLLYDHGSITDNKNSSSGEFGIGCGVLLLSVRVIVSTRGCRRFYSDSSDTAWFFHGQV